MRKVRAEGNRDFRHYISLTNFYNIKLKKLAIACNMTAAEMSYFCLVAVLHNRQFSEEFIRYLKTVKNEKRKSPGRGGARVAKHFLSLDLHMNDYLIEASWKAGIQPATFHFFALKYCLDSPSFIKFMQDEYNTNDDYRVVPVIENGEVFY